MYISLWENSRGHPDNVSFMQFSTKIDGFEQKDSQGFEYSYNSYEQYPLEKFFIFTIYQNYTLALTRPYVTTPHDTYDHLNTILVPMGVHKKHIIVPYLTLYFHNHISSMHETIGNDVVR